MQPSGCMLTPQDDGHLSALALQSNPIQIEILEDPKMIEVRRTGASDPFRFDVIVRAGQGESRHEVTLSREVWERLTAGKHAPELVIEAAFRFLLDREPKESILGRFDVTVISRYFPEFARELPRYLPQ